jgi:hypothetical protein
MVNSVVGYNNGHASDTNAMENGQLLMANTENFWRQLRQLISSQSINERQHIMSISPRVNKKVLQFKTRRSNIQHKSFSAYTAFKLLLDSVHNSKYTDQ